MTKELEMLYNIVNNVLRFDCPVLSGNMKANIRVLKAQGNKVELVIRAPQYDVEQWRKTGYITMWNYNPDKHYAKSVNDSGGFGTHNKSEHWVNRALNSSCESIAPYMNATVINKLPL